MTNSVIATAYPEKSEYEEWAAEAESRGMSISEYIQAMIRAGQKKFNVDVNPDETNQDLRESRDYYKTEVRKLRRKVEQLESQNYGGEAAAIDSFVQANPGASASQIINHVKQTAANRVSSHLSTMTGAQLANEDGEYYSKANRSEGE